MSHREQQSSRKKVIREKNAVRRIRFSTSAETMNTSHEDSIQVYARVKPSSTIEDNYLKFTESNIQFTETDKRGAKKSMRFSFNRVLFPDVTQEQLFNTTVSSNVDQLLNGEDRLIFSYGTTGSGKSYTIMGNNTDPGVIPRCTFMVFRSLDDLLEETPLCPNRGCNLTMLDEEQLAYHNSLKEHMVLSVEASDTGVAQVSFSYSEQNLLDILMKLCEEVKPCPIGLNHDVKYAIWMSYLEVYNENIYDLLDIAKTKKPLKVGFDSKKNNYVKGLTHINVTTWMEMWKVFLYGRQNLHTNETLLNKSSSRSHSIFTLRVMKLDRSGTASVSSLSMCDLAGCERQKKAQNQGDRLKESLNINTSLMILNRCFSSVRENRVMGHNKIPPYRDSKLTMIFQKAFSYGEHIDMFVNLSQSRLLLEETKNVLKVSSVAQEMAVTIPKLQKFLKPAGRFSILCAEPKYPVLSGSKNHRRAAVESGCSGIFTLSNTMMSNDCYNEMIKNYEEKISLLEDDKKKMNDEIESLVDTIEEARAEYLNLEEKLRDAQVNLADEEIAYEDLENDHQDLGFLYEAKLNALKDMDVAVAERDKKISNLKEEMNQLAEVHEKEVQQLHEEIATLKLKIQEQAANNKEQDPVTKPARRRALLSKCIQLDSAESSPDVVILDDLTVPPTSASSALLLTPVQSKRKVRPTRSTRKVTDYKENQ